ncbi:helix-turn-helix domain-containing protein [Bacteroides sp.]
MENRELARCLDVSLRMLQSLRERGIIGYSMIGKKIYYRIDDVKEVIENGKIISNIWEKKE